MKDETIVAAGPAPRVRPGDRLVSSAEARHRLGGMSKMTEWRRQQSDPDFPKPIHINGNVKVYISRELDDYLAALVARSDAAKAA